MFFQKHVRHTQEFRKQKFVLPSIFPLLHVFPHRNSAKDKKLYFILHRERQAQERRGRDRETERRRDGETERRRDGETERRRDEETEGQ